MKKLILAAMLTGFAAGAYAQGTVSFQNALIAPKIQTNYQGNVGLATKNTFRVALYWGVAGSTEGQLVEIANLAGSSADGVFFQGVVTTPNGTAPGANASFQVRGWTGNFATYEAAYAAAIGGQSGILLGATTVFLNGTGGAGSPPSVAPNLTGWTQNLQLTPVPEPSTIALAGLGAASLLLFRRRK